MTRAVTAEEMKKLDRHAIEDLGISSETLMDRAGQAVALEAEKMSTGRKVTIICGKGNNGGDGLVAARYLKDKSYGTSVIMASAFKEPDKVTIRDSDLIIDAIFGIGLNAPLKEPYLLIVTFINSLGKKVLSVDVPSGLNATTGEVMGGAVKAAKTVTFAAAKTGFYKGEGPKYCGQIVVVDIGIPA